MLKTTRLVQSAVYRGRLAVSGRFDDVVGFFYYAGKRFYYDNCFQTASALTYTALLAMVPLMTIVFSVFSAFPAFHRLRDKAQDMLFNNLVPEVGQMVQGYLNGFMNNAGQSTAFGVIGLAISAALLLSTIEGAFGSIWRVNEPRPLLVRLLSFWAILTFSPLLFGTSLSVGAQFVDRVSGTELERLTQPLYDFGPHIPGMVEALGFTLLYIIIPNRAVNWADAVVGGVAAALVLEGSKSGFAWYLHEFPAYQTIYGALSTVPIFLLWLYIAWSTILVGAVITASLPEWRAGGVSRNNLQGLPPVARVAVALAVLMELLTAARRGSGLRRRLLVDRVRVGSVLVEGMLEQLREVDWVARTTQDTWVLTRDLAESTLWELQEALGMTMRGSVADLPGLDQGLREKCRVFLEAAEDSHRGILNVNLKDLLMSSSLGAFIEAGGGSRVAAFLAASGALATAEEKRAGLQAPVGNGSAVSLITLHQAA